MALFGSFKVAPGVRISASTRGVRTHLGPRVARLHVGGGRSGLSTGAGPVTMYSHLAPSTRSRPSRSSAEGMTPAQAEKARRVEEAAQEWAQLAQIHRIEFDPIAAPEPVVTEPVPMFSVLLRQAERRHLRSVGRFDRLGRTEARRRAREEAEAEALRLLAGGIEDRDRRQEASDRAWAALVKGEPDAVEAAVSGALTARGLPVTVVSRRVGHVRIDVQVPGADAIPTHRPAVTAKGAPTLKKLTKTETAFHQRQQAAAGVLLVAKEARSQSSAISEVEVVASRGRDPLMRTTLTSASLRAAPWRMDAWDVLLAADPQLETNIGGRTQELRPLT